MAKAFRHNSLDEKAFNSRKYMCVCVCVYEVRCLVKLQWKHTLIELFHSAVNKQKSKVAAALPVLHGEFVRYATSSSSSGQTDVCVCVSACVRVCVFPGLSLEI